MRKRKLILPLSPPTFVGGESKAAKLHKEIFKDYEDGNQRIATSGQVNSIRTSELVFSCVDYIAKAASQAQPRLVELDKNGEPTQVKDKALLEWEIAPNPYYTWGELIELMVQSLLLAGIAPVTFEKVGGRYESYAVTSPHKLSVVPDPNKYIKGFLYDDTIAYSVDELVYVKNPVLNNEYYGLPSVAPLLDTLELESFAINDLKALYQNSVIITGLLKAKYQLSPQQVNLLREQFESLFSLNGSKRRGFAILPNEMDFTPIQMSPKDAQLLDSLEIAERRVLQVFRLHPIVLGGEEKATSKPDELMSVTFNTAVRPLLYRIADAFSLFLYRKTKKRIRFEFDVKRITELDTPLDTKARSVKELATTGIASFNEARQIVGLPKINEPWADKHTIPAYLTGKIENTLFFEDAVSSKNDEQQQSDRSKSLIDRYFDS